MPKCPIKPKLSMTEQARGKIAIAPHKKRLKKNTGWFSGLNREEQEKLAVQEVSLIYALANTFKDLPNEKILVETDSPYLAPSPVRGSVNEPKNCIHTAKFLSKLRNVNFFDLSETLFNNSLTIYDKIKFWKDK